MLQRKIEKFLQTWKQVPQHNPLVVKAAATVGKPLPSWILPKRNTTMWCI